MLKASSQERTDLEPGHLNETASTQVDPEGCRLLNEVFSMIGDKWTVLIIMKLADGPRRFNEIRRSLEGVSQQMLARTLKTLERNGFVNRTVHPTVPPQVEYKLTELGESLHPTVAAIDAWTWNNLSRISTAQHDYDGVVSAHQ